MEVSIRELAYSSMDIISAINLCGILNITVEDYFSAVKGGI